MMAMARTRTMAASNPDSLASPSLSVTIKTVAASDEAVVVALEEAAAIEEVVAALEEAAVIEEAVAASEEAAAVTEEAAAVSIRAKTVDSREDHLEAMTAEVVVVVVAGADSKTAKGSRSAAGASTGGETEVLAAMTVGRGKTKR